MYLPTTAMRTSPSGECMALDDPLPARQVRLLLERQAEMPQHFAVHALGVIADRHRVDRIGRPARRSPPRAARCRTARSCGARSPGSAGRSGTAASAAGCRRSAAPSPSAASAWSSARRPTGCTAPASGARTSPVRGPSSLPSWRMASRNGRLSMSPTVPPISTSTKSTPAVPRTMVSLISSVMCGITCTVAPR